MSDNGTILQMQQVVRKIGEKTIVDNFSADFAKGKIYTIIGPSGAGKSSLLRLINRLDDPDSGTILFYGNDTLKISPCRLRCKIGFLFQTPYMFPGTVQENLFYAECARNDETARHLADLVHLEHDFLDADVDTLSVGQKQRVALGRLLATSPEIVLLDEPTSALDPSITEAIEKTIKEIVERTSLTVIMVTHDPAQALRMTGDTLLLVNGRIRHQRAGYQQPGHRPRAQISIEAAAMNSMEGPTFVQVALALVLVVIAIIVSRVYKLKLSKDMSIGTVRSFIQLVAVGYALEFIFDLDSPWLIILTILIMLTIGAYTSVDKVKKLGRVFQIAWIAMAAGSFVTLAVMLAVDIIPFNSRYIIPLGGMIISNSMNASALAMTRLTADLRANALAVETSLALGKSWREASRGFQREAATAGMLSILNFMKTVGIVALPGAMTGMILGGADPLEAVLLQIIVAYMLLAAVTMTSIVAVELTIRRFFTSNHQLRRLT